MAYKIEIESTFAGFWRYNIAVTCGLFGDDGERCGFVSAENSVAPVGSNLDSAPAGTPSHRRLTFTADDCARLRMYIYLIPHSLPQTEKIGECKPFALTIKAEYDGEVVLRDRRSINQWSGASIELDVERPQPRKPDTM